MTTDRPRRLAAASILLAASLGLAACGTGFDAATSQQYQPAVGTNQREGDVRLYNTLLVQNTDGTFSLSVGIVNTTDTDQELTGATFVPLSEEGALSELEPAVDVSVPAGGLYTLGPAGEFAGFEVDGLGEGRFATITLTFDGVGDVVINAPVVNRAARYAEIPESSPEDEAPLEVEPSEDEQAELVPVP
ncbi:hypothetical protein GCM10009821_26600 [Aeromicrobium halocynthiae]|uniref:DNA modification methylase n=1 Tax=Aeromicrobium halocynthiae TaxID=560557 RepID=A0ABP5HUH2_9ACTN